MKPCKIKLFGNIYPNRIGVYGCLAGSLFAAFALPVYAANLGGIDIHGTAAQGYIHSQGNNYIKDSKDGSFDFREYGLNATFTFWEKASIGAQVFGREFGTVGNDKPYLDWLKAEYAWRDWLRIRAGKLKVPYGFYGETRDISSLRTCILLPLGVYPEFVRGSLNSAWAGSFAGNISMEDIGDLDYSVQFGKRNIDVDNGEYDRMFAERDLSIDGSTEEPAAAGALVWQTPLDGLRVGATLSWDNQTLSGTADNEYSTDAFDAEMKDMLMVIGSVQYMRAPFTLTAEYMDTGFRLSYNYNSPVIPGMKQKFDFHGWYIMSDWRVIDRLTMAVGFSHFEQKSTINMEGVPSNTVEEDLDDWFLSVRFDLTENFILKAEQHISRGTAGIFENENPDGVEEDWSMTLVQAIFVF